ARRLDLQQVGPEAVTIVTNSLNIAGEMVLRPSIRTVVIGGVARSESYELHGPFASRVLQDLLLERLFLGVDGLTPGEGASCHHCGESGSNSEMVAKAGRGTVVADSSKLGKVALARICPIEQVDGLVTDTAAPAGVVADLEAVGVAVTLV
ncbi:MAG: DeoR/GlpR family DNA-binding transcription regulator, partial [Thermoleophilaceae bacterium]